MNTISQAKKHILVIDKEMAMCMAVKDILEAISIPVLITNNGSEAIRLFQTHHHEIALVILDLNMPDMTGQEILTRLRRIDPRIFVIFSSGYLGAGVKFQDLHVDGFLHKPYTINDLMLWVKTVMPANQTLL